MRVRVGISFTALSCAGAAVVTAGCFSASSGGSGPQTDFDASLDSSFPIDDSSVDSFVPPAEAGPEAMAVDSGVGPVDEGAPLHEAAVEAGCGPIDITGFVVPPYVSAQGQSIYCNDSEDYWFSQQCFGPGATLETCANFATSSAADAGPDAGPFITSSGCAACLLTAASNDAGTGWGPGVAGTIVTPNLAGCIELADNSPTGIACAQTVQAAAQCVDYACRTSCPVTDDASRAAYLACTATAATGVCGTYTAAANVCIANEIGDAGPTNVSTWCFAGPDTTTQYAEMALFFCSS
jgi:hypothetical protein